MIYNQISGLFHSAEFVPFIGTAGLSKKEDAEQKLKEHENVNRQTLRRLEETAVICTLGLQYQHVYTHTRASRTWYRGTREREWRGERNTRLFLL